MSAFASAPAETQAEDLSPSRDAHGFEGGQNHDRIQSLEKNMAGSHSNHGDSIGDVSVLQRMSSATLGSLITSLLVTPLDVVRVRLQSQPATTSMQSNARFAPHTTSFQNLPPNLGITACCREVFWVGDNAQYCLAGPSQTIRGSEAANSAECAIEETQRKTFTSTLDGLRKIAKNEGPLTLWRGLSPTLLMAIPANVIYFTAYDWLRFSHTSPIKRVVGDTYSPLIAGSTARVASAFVVSPIEMFRTRMQASSASGNGLFSATLNGLHEMTQTQGYTSLWRGLTLTMWRDVPFSGIYWWGYEYIRGIITETREKSHKLSGSLTKGDSAQSNSNHNHSIRDFQSQHAHMTTFVDSFVAGTVSGAWAALITTPFDVGKTRQQVYRHSCDQPLQSAAKVVPEELSMPRFLLHILRTEGTSGLFKGWAARCLKVAPSCGIMISSYELGKKWAKVMNEHKETKKEAL